MTTRVASFFPTGFNNYVPAMAFAADLIHGQPATFSLGSPAAADPDIIDTDIDGDATAGTETAQAWTADGTYGRTLTMTASADPGNAPVYDVYGTDYLGQPVIERFTHVNGSAPVIYGKKAFYTVNNVIVVTAATNAITVDLGTGLRLGLPYKGDVSWAKENGVLVPVYNRTETFWHHADAAAVVAGFSAFIRAPFPGYVGTLRAQPSGGGSTTNAATTVELGGTAITGLTVTADQDTATQVTDVPTTEGYGANNRFVAGGLIEIVHAATTSGGAMRVGLDLVPTQFVHPILTDPQTAILGDPRGTYESLMTFDGSEIIVGLLGDPSVNSDGNGGLHGIQHYYA